jgi:hypothetical protein
MTRRTDGPFFIYEILPGQLFQRGKLKGYSVTVKEKGLAYYGITDSVQLAPPQPDRDLMLISNTGGSRYQHLPIPDGLLHDGDYLVELAANLAGAITSGRVVLTMCNAGRNRSGLLSALIVRELTGLPGAAAMAVVRQHRPNAIANPHFERFLEGLG